ncbi:restriction endonuclease subunit S [Fusobacterium animalis]|uniref:restriction endonuclease subunit S n=1 Tax=Fusobacterium animalis TaxID=76859 RepID=UPI0030D1EE81
MKIYNKSEWKKVKLGDVCEIITGNTPLKKVKEYWNKDEVPFITPPELKYEGINYITPNIFVSQMGASQGRIIPKNSICVCCIGSLGKLGILKEEGITNQQINSLVLKNKNIDLLYLYFYLKTIKNNLEAIASSTTVKIINKSSFEKIEIKLPDIKIQKKISKKLELLENNIDFRKRQLNYLKDLTKSLFTRMFGNPFYSNKIKEDNRSFLKDIAIINPTKKEIEYIENNLEISFVTMADISENGEINVNNIKKLEDVKNNFTFFKEGDVLFAKITPCMENGKGGVAKNLKNNIGFGTTEIHIIRPIPNITNSQWLYHLTKLPLFRKDAEIHMTGSAGQKRVPTTYLSNFKIKVPPIELQNKFAERVEKIEKLSFIFDNSIISRTFRNLYKKVSA